MSRLDRMEMLLRQEFSPSHLKVRDDSAKHAGHAGAREGGETHYHIDLISGVFVGKNRVQRHQAVYAALKDEMDGENAIHALSMSLKTENE